MVDRELVITHLRIIHTWSGFALERDLQFFTKKHLEDIEQWTADALELLKEKKPVKPRADSIRRFRCGACEEIIGRGQHYCGKCGMEVDWDA